MRARAGANARGGIIIYVRRTVGCTSRGCAAAVDLDEEEKKPARRANISEGAGVMLLWWQIL